MAAKKVMPIVNTCFFIIQVWMILKNGPILWMSSTDRLSKLQTTLVIIDMIWILAHHINQLTQLPKTDVSEDSID